MALKRVSQWSRYLLLLLLLTQSVFTQTVLAQALDRQKLITLRFQDAPIRIILQALADYQQLNLVIADSVSGNYSLRLEQVDWQLALNAILQLAQLDIEIQHNIMLVVPQAEKLARKKRTDAEKVAQQQQKPLHSLNYAIKYANAAQLASMLQEGQDALLSERGSLFVDERTNTLIVRDVAEVLATVERLLEHLDKVQQQVQLVAHIVSMSSESLRELGVVWGMSESSGVEQSMRLSNFNVTLPVANPSIGAGVHIARLNGRLLSLELSALEAENSVEIVASPYLLTADRQTASIKQGSEIPYEVAGNDSGSTSIEFKDAVLGLEVTPRILPGNKIEMILRITQNTPGRAIKNSKGGEVLVIDTQEIRTQVMVGHGETLVLGGVFQQDRSNTVTQVPFLSRIPLLGRLFRRDSYQQGRRELVIFITPQIVIA